MKTYKLRELRKKLKKHSSQFNIIKNKGKGGHLTLYHPDINGKARSYPLPSMTDGSDVDRNYYKHIIRRFNLPDDFF